MMELIDREKELARLNKELTKAEKELGMFTNQLSNPKFVEKAPQSWSRRPAPSWLPPRTKPPRSRRALRRWGKSEGFPVGKLSPQVTDEGSVSAAARSRAILAHSPLIRPFGPPSPQGKAFQPQTKITPPRQELHPDGAGFSLQHKIAGKSSKQITCGACPWRSLRVLVLAAAVLRHSTVF